MIKRGYLLDVQCTKNLKLKTDIISLFLSFPSPNKDDASFLISSLLMIKITYISVLN